MEESRYVPGRLGETIVRAYGESLAGGSRGNRAITQSAIDLKALDNLAPRVKTLAANLKSRDQQAKDIHLDSALFRAGREPCGTTTKTTLI